MPARKKPQTSRNKSPQKGYAGTSVLYFVILTGAIVIGSMLAGSSLPEQNVKRLDQTIVTVVPKEGGKAQPNLQLQTFEGVIGLPTQIDTPQPSPTIANTN